MAKLVPYLSTRCASCGDRVSMPPTSEPALVNPVAQLDYDHPVSLYAVLHLCTNKKLNGSTVGYYTLWQNRGFDYEYHDPEHRAFRAPEEIPERPRILLQEANDARNTPSACTATAVRAVEAMMAEFGYRERKLGLKKRIDTAVEDRVLPPMMGEWADEVREFGNVTHTDEQPEPLPDKKEAEMALLFANYLARYLFVLPARIKKARGKKKPRARARPKSGGAVRTGPHPPVLPAAKK